MRHTDITTGAVAVELAAVPNAVAARVHATTAPVRFPGEKGPRRGKNDIIDVSAEQIVFAALTPGGTTITVTLQLNGVATIEANRHGQTVVDLALTDEGDTTGNGVR